MEDTKPLSDRLTNVPRKPHERKEGDLGGEENEDDDGMHYHDDLALTSTMTDHK